MREGSQKIARARARSPERPDRAQAHHDHAADPVVPETPIAAVGPRTLTPRIVLRLQRTAGNQAVVRLLRGGGSLQRTIEMQQVGRRHAAAWARRQQLVDRLNRQSRAIQYRLDGNVLRSQVVDAAGLSDFDQRMRDLTQGGQTIPLRLITRSGYVQDDTGAWVPLLVDSYVMGYLDVDDMLACDDLSFRLNLLHLLVERAQTRRYARRIGTNIPRAEFLRGHRAGLAAEVNHLRSVIGDNRLRLISERERANGTLVFVYRSPEGYRVIHIFRRGGQEERGGEVYALWGSRRLTIAELSAERARRAAAVPAAP